VVIKKKEFEVAYCDFCGKEIGIVYQTFSERDKCIVCRKHVCDDCNAGRDLSWQGWTIRICKDCIEDLTVKEYIALVRAHRQRRELHGEEEA